MRFQSKSHTALDIADTGLDQWALTAGNSSGSWIPQRSDMGATLGKDLHNDHDIEDDLDGDDGVQDVFLRLCNGSD